ncbi:MAG TPA: hypothetical protein VFZ33_03915 [Chitinophagaceae bacterium]
MRTIKVFSQFRVPTTANRKNYPVFGIDNAGDKEYIVGTADSDGRNNNPILIANQKNLVERYSRSGTLKPVKTIKSLWEKD